MVLGKDNKRISLLPAVLGDDDQSQKGQSE